MNNPPLVPTRDLVPAQDFVPARDIDTLTAVAGVALTDTQRAGVIVHLEAAAEMARLLDAVHLPPDELAPAPVFTPGARTVR